jgi:hypothetical protein
MAVTNSFVHEIDISRWLTGSEMISAQIASGPGGEPLMITMRTDRDEIVSTEVYVNAAYGYHIHAELVGREGTVALAPSSLTLRNKDRIGGLSYPDNWIPRFADAYRRQLTDWTSAVTTGTPVGASAWDGYVASAIAEQIAAGLDREPCDDAEISVTSVAVRLNYGARGTFHPLSMHSIGETQERIDDQLCRRRRRLDLAASVPARRGAVRKFAGCGHRDRRPRKGGAPCGLLRHWRDCRL